MQAAPALSLAAGVAIAVLWPARGLPAPLRVAARVGGVLIVSFAAFRVTDFDKIPANASHDLAYMSGRISRAEHLTRFGGRAQDKYVAFSVSRLAEYLESDGQSPQIGSMSSGFRRASYVQADRVSASRFFWSMPVVSGFNAESARYGARGLLDELEARKPCVCRSPDGRLGAAPRDSATFFLTHPLLGAWLSGGYDRLAGARTTRTMSVWVKRSVAAGGVRR